MENEHKEITKQRILRVAAKLFANKSFEGVSTREICKEANINVSMISYYFGGKKELYDAILKNLVEKQTEYAKKITDIYGNPEKLTKAEQIEILYNLTDRFVDFFYSNITNDLILLLLKAQQQPDFSLKSPTFNFLRKLLAQIFEQDENSKEMIFKTISIISFINSPKIMPALSLRLLGQDEFTEEDIKIIRKNLKTHIKMLLKESGIV